MEAATGYLDFALAGFADHALVDLADPAGRLVRSAGTPGGPGPCLPVVSAGIPVRYEEGHPALQALERTGSVRSLRRCRGERASELSLAGRHGGAGCARCCAAGAAPWGSLTFLRGTGRQSFDRADAAYAEDTAARVAAALDLPPR